MQRLSFLFLFILLGFYSHGQDRIYLDSLKRDLYNSKKDTAKVNSLAAIAYEYLYYNPDTSLQFARDGLDLARKINYKQGEVLCLNRTGMGYTQLGNNADALQLLLMALQEAEKIGWDRGVILEKFIMRLEIMAVQFSTPKNVWRKAKNTINGITKWFAMQT